MTTRKLVPLATAADIVGVSVKTLRRRINEEKLRAYRVGALIKVDPDDLEQIIRPIGRRSSSPQATTAE